MARTSRSKSDKSAKKEAPQPKTKAATKSKAKPKTEKASKAKDDANESIYEVEQIVDYRNVSAVGPEYYVKWKNYPTTSNSWEPAGNIYSSELIREFESSRAEAATRPEYETDEDSGEGPSKTPPAKASAKKRGATKVNKIPVPSRRISITNIVPKVTTRVARGAAAKVIKATGVTRKSLVKRGAASASSKRDKKDEEQNATDDELEAAREMDIELNPDVPEEVSKDKTFVLVPGSTPAGSTRRSQKPAPTSSTKKMRVVAPRAGALRRKFAPDVVEESEEQTELAKPLDMESAKRTRASLINGTASPTEKRNVPQKRSPQDSIDFSKVKFAKIINDSVVNKSMTLLGTYEDESIILKLEKTLFDEGKVRETLAHKSTVSERDFLNDVYSTYVMRPGDSSCSLNNIKTTVIFPASDSSLEKYSRSETILFSETPDVYSRVVEPYIENKLKNEPDYNQWVYNILSGDSEQDRIIMNDPDPDSGFMLVYDLKWHGYDEYLNLLAICHRRDIRSVRDLSDKHMILLKNILTKGTKVIKEKFKDSFKDGKRQLRSFVHYQPSFYHFHVHFQAIDASEYNASDRDILLSDIINSIGLNKDYYKKSTLTYPLAVSSILHKDLKRAKRL